MFFDSYTQHINREKVYEKHALEYLFILFFKRKRGKKTLSFARIEK